MKTLDPDDPRHGTRNGYANLGCRCEPCSQAESSYQEKRRRSRGGKPWPEAFKHLEKHGGKRYKKGCRCDICRAASAAEKRRHRAKHAEHYREYGRQQKAAYRRKQKTNA